MKFADPPGPACCAAALASRTVEPRRSGTAPPSFTGFPLLTEVPIQSIEPLVKPRGLKSDSKGENVYDVT